MIDTANDLLDAYIRYQQNRGIAPMSAGATTKVGIAAIVSYFNMKDYRLSAELLIHMENNTNLNSSYSPIWESMLRGQPRWNTYRTGLSSRGSGEFKKDEDPLDLYYAIHLYNWTRDNSTKKITLSDRYDFEYNDRYSGLAGTAINFLAVAQDRGEILPFYTTVRNL